MKSREINECSYCGRPKELHTVCPSAFIPVVVWELTEAEVKLLEAKK